MEPQPIKHASATKSISLVMPPFYLGDDQVTDWTHEDLVLNRKEDFMFRKFILAIALVALALVPAVAEARHVVKQRVVVRERFVSPFFFGHTFISTPGFVSFGAVLPSPVLGTFTPGMTTFSNQFGQVFVTDAFGRVIQIR